MLLGALVRLRGAPSVRERLRTLTLGVAVLLLAVARRAAVPPHLRRRRATGSAASTERAPFGTWARDHGALYGLFAFLVATAYAHRGSRRSRHPWRTAAWSAAAAVFVGSLLAAADLVAVAARCSRSAGWRPHAAFSPGAGASSASSGC